VNFNAIFCFIFNRKNLVLRHKSITFVILFFVAAAVTGSCAGGGEPKIAFETQELSITLSNGGHIPVIAEIAKSPEQRERGLMYRKTLEDGHGMLFIFEKDQVLSFWMKNTFVPLSIAFISSDGVILEIMDMKPESTVTVTSSRSARYALEVPQGWFSRMYVEPGNTITLPSVAAAVAVK
jgi:uncharacterized membrane protein (UPF0127 family)